jgi:hypothetical protein
LTLIGITGYVTTIYFFLDGGGVGFGTFPSLRPILGGGVGFGLGVVGCGLGVSFAIILIL